MFENIKAIKEFDPAAKSYIEIILCYPGLHAIWFHHIAHFLYKIKFPLLPRLVNTFSRFLTGIDIHPGATISPGIMIDHGQGVVIGETAVVGKGCLIYQGVTLGGTGKESGKRHPTLKDNVVVGAGAKVLGNIVIEKDVRIGAGSVVMQHVPESCTVVGIPGRIVRSPHTSGKSREQMLEHGEMPDPLSKAFSLLVQRIDHLETEIEELYRLQKKPAPKAAAPTDDDDFLDQFIGGAGI